MAKKFNSDMGLYLKKLREERGFTQKQVNEFVGMKRTWISDIERGKSRIYYQDILELCKSYEKEALAEAS